jgi:hypothetical protein
MNDNGESAVTWDGARNGMALQLFDETGDRIGGEQAGPGSLVGAAIADDGHGVLAAALNPGGNRSGGVVVHSFGPAG